MLVQLFWFHVIVARYILKQEFIVVASFHEGLRLQMHFLFVINDLPLDTLNAVPRYLYLFLSHGIV